MSFLRPSHARARALLLLCLLLLLPAARAAAQQPAPLPAEKVRQIEALIRAEMARQKTKDGKETTYGLGWGVAEHNGQRAIGHSGGQQRVSTFLHMQPDQGIAVVLMSNLENARLGDLAQQIGDVLLK